MSGATSVKTMRLRYAGSCAGCGASVPQGERAHYLREEKVVRCLPCGPGVDASAPAGLPEARDSRTSVLPAPPPAPVLPLGPDALVPGPPPVAAPVPSGLEEHSDELSQGELPRAGACGDCGRRLRRGTDALFSATVMLCLECVALDTAHSLGIPGGGARREHEKRLARHHTKVRTAHPKLGGIILALRDDPSHVRAWQIGAVGEEQFGARLSSVAGEALKVLHDRKVPRSAANIDHLAVTAARVWVIDAKRYKGRVETRGHGLLSRRPPDLYVGGRNQMKLVEGVQKQVDVVREALEGFAAEHRVAEIPVRGALVFIDAEFGLFASPFAVDGVWIGWGKAIRQRLAEEAKGPLPVGDLAKRLARELRPG